MTTKRKPPSEDGPSFSAVWKWLTGIASVVVGAAFLGVFGWAWSIANDLTKLTSAMESNTDSIKALGSRVDHLQEIDTSQTATLATVQAQISNAQSNQAASAISLSERIRAMEQQQMWRDRMQPQQQQPRGR